MNRHDLSEEVGTKVRYSLRTLVHERVMIATQNLMNLRARIIIDDLTWTLCNAKIDRISLSLQGDIIEAD